MVVRQYKAKGPVTSTLLPVVAMDDAVGLVVFAISLALAQAFGSGQALSLKTTLVDPLVEIMLSLAVGLALGALVAIVTRFFPVPQQQAVRLHRGRAAGRGPFGNVGPVLPAAVHVPSARPSLTSRARAKPPSSWSSATAGRRRCSCSSS